MQHSQFELFILVLLLRALVTGKIQKRLKKDFITNDDEALSKWKMDINQMNNNYRFVKNIAHCNTTYNKP